MINPRIEGLVAAPFTPMYPDGSIAYERIPALVEHLATWNVRGLFVCGSTGEGPSLTVAERQKLAEAFVTANRGRLFLFVHVGHNSLTEAKSLARHAQEIGANAISATAPTYFKLNTIDALANSLQLIAEGAPQLPLYYYNIPALTGVSLNMLALLESAQKEIPTLAGIKYTTPLLHEYQACVRFSDNRYQILYGSDEMLLGALACGAKAFIGSTYNFMAPIYHRVIRAFNQKHHEDAQQYQALSVATVRLIFKYGGLPAQKAIMRMIGQDCGPVRLPLTTLTPSTYETLESELQTIGFFNAVKSDSL
ncbi:dihydrodipicolinate synthase family protein [Tunicatimonas pelagia]|uniref:dihydrodipicolinate synthase family protein n=1 Tax=Tunicatimonas pelagia TaxID=931531 RepID=UPI002665B263|nr:dihydrodipicolinate synthase family protein [Tunicatimonas pelagia]WKN44210.1 dihydrodipicolinate synthase family protein [Tunicatimonas pelagia]